MKVLKYLLPIIITTILVPLQSKAQDQLAVPLSNPGKPGKLKVGIVRGSIKVHGYDGKQVLISYNSSEDEKQEVTKDGLHKISNNSVGFDVSEDHNEVEVDGASPMKDISFDISVPKNFDLHLSTVNGGELVVEDVTGEMDLSNVNGEITLNNVGGSALVNTVNGDIKATFTSVTPDKPMAFSNLNGDIDVTFPANTAMNTKMKSEWGDVYTDFDMSIKRTDTEKEHSSEDGTYKVSVNKWIYGTINGGGPEYLFKSMRGDIYIRKK
ncbi:MAG TPA: DUF4097 family beta strand repeat-containing protein [Balneolaceae bacterium]|nr:DUF4097 family beta strand repeat-containing protein [Balneolaceae bacterium]